MAEQYRYCRTPPRNACPKIRSRARATPLARKGLFLRGLLAPTITRATSRASARNARGSSRPVRRTSQASALREGKSAHAPTARGPGSQRHAVDFGFVENLLRRRACSLPAAEVSPALARDAIDAMASRARRHAERPRPTIRTRTRRTFPRETDRDRALEHAIAPREPTRPFRFERSIADRRPFDLAIIERLSIERNSRKKTFDVVLLLLQDAGREADHG